MYVCHAVSCTELFDPATTAAATNWALMEQSVSQPFFRGGDDSHANSDQELTAENSFRSNERQPAGDIDPPYEETLVRLVIDANYHRCRSSATSIGTRKDEPWSVSSHLSTARKRNDTARRPSARQKPSRPDSRLCRSCRRRRR